MEDIRLYYKEQLDNREKYIKDWLLEIRDYDENGNPILNLETVYSIGLLEELIQYNRKSKFDNLDKVSFALRIIKNILK